MRVREGFGNKILGCIAIHTTCSITENDGMQIEGDVPVNSTLWQLSNSYVLKKDNSNPYVYLSTTYTS